MRHILGMDTVVLHLAFIDGIGAPEMGLIFVLILVLFGGQKLPEFARGLGKSIREFKKAAAGVEEEFKRALDEDERQRAATPRIMPPEPTPALPPASPSSEASTAVVDVTTTPASSETTPSATASTPAPEAEVKGTPLPGEDLTPPTPAKTEPPAASGDAPPKP